MRLVTRPAALPERGHEQVHGAAGQEPVEHLTEHWQRVGRVPAVERDQRHEDDDQGVAGARHRLGRGVQAPPQRHAAQDGEGGGRVGRGDDRCEEDGGPQVDVQGEDGDGRGHADGHAEHRQEQ